MPMDRLSEYYSNIMNWEDKFCLIPRRCQLTGKSIWLTNAIRGSRMITGPGDPVVITYWRDKQAHFIWKLSR